MTAQELQKRIKEGESQILEFKESFQEEALQTIGAFANTQGGMLIIGVSDSGIPTGVSIGKATLREITDRIAACTDPRVIPDIQSMTIDGHNLIIIQIPEYPIKPVAVRGRCFKRIGDSNRQLSPVAIAELHMASTGTSWDARLIPGQTIRNLDTARIRRYMTLSTNIGRRRFEKGSKPAEVLEKLELIRDEQLTWAAALLFGKNPQSPLTQATVHCGRFRTEIDIVDDRLIDGSIIDQVEETMDFLKKHINVQFIITGKPQRDQIWDYPLEALREAVVNAICHRDYGDNADIQIKVFDDRIWIWSPGKLPFGMNISELYNRSHASKPRNKLIAQIFYDLEIIERYGSGIQRMLDACTAAGLPEPTIEESTGGVAITFTKRTPPPAQGAAQVNSASPHKSRLESEQVAPQVTPQDNHLPISALQDFDSILGTSTPQVTPQVAAQVTAVLKAARVESSREILQGAADIRDREHFRKAYIEPLLAAGLIERTIPDKPTSRLQKYRLTEKGRKIISEWSNE